MKSKNFIYLIILCIFCLRLASGNSALAQTPESVTMPDTTAIAAMQYAETRSWETLGLSTDERATFQGLVKALKLADGCQDLSDAMAVKIQEPQLAYVNLTGISSIPSSKHTTHQAWMEVYDGNGHYFKKRILIKGQGGYSLRFPKRNFSMQFCNENWTETTTPDFHIGNWVRQDGFHFKAFYTDFSRGIGEIGYKWYRRVVADRKPFWERGGYTKESAQALCVPDGFPCVVYLEGKFQGIYAWQLKKHRRNMNMKKDVAEHIHLDGNVSDQYLFDGKISWGQFEVRNPKHLYTKSNQLYDGNYPKELMDENSSGYSNQNENKKRSALVKKAVQKLSQYKKELAGFESQGAMVVKREFAKRFDVETLLDYQVYFRMLMNGDGTLKNWQWFTYDGVKWMVTPYDLDQTFGITLYGFPRPATHTLCTITTGPFPFITKYYAEEERNRYIELRKKGVLTEDVVLPIIYDWYDRVGTDWYDMEKKRWPESPCYCEAICNDGWTVCDDWSLYNDAPAFSYNTTYKKGDICVLDGRIWEATRTISGKKPYVRNSDIDTIERLVGWVTDRLQVLDEFYAYEHQPNDVEVPQLSNGFRQVKAIYTLDGKRIPRLQRGINVVRYTDGTSRLIQHKDD